MYVHEIPCLQKGNIFRMLATRILLMNEFTYFDSTITSNGENTTDIVHRISQERTIFCKNIRLRRK